MVCCFFLFMIKLFKVRDLFLFSYLLVNTDRVFPLLTQLPTLPTHHVLKKQGCWMAAVYFHAVFLVSFSL